MKKRAESQPRKVKEKRPIPEIPLGLRVGLVNCPGASNHGRWFATYWGGGDSTVAGCHAETPIGAALGAIRAAAECDAGAGGGGVVGE